MAHKLDFPDFIYTVTHFFDRFFQKTLGKTYGGESVHRSLVLPKTEILKKSLKCEYF